jgi:hypothetical protein
MIRAFAILLAFAVSGCFLSEEPFITPETADYPIASDSYFDAYARRGDDWSPLPEGRRVRIQNGYYYYRNDGSDRTSVPFLMKEISEGRYVVQANDTSTFERVSEYYYFLVDFDGTEAIQHRSRCWPREEWLENRIIAGIEYASTNTRCTFDSFENLVTVLEGTTEFAAPEDRFVLNAAGTETVQ